MTDKKYTPSFTAEFRERGVRLYREHRTGYRSDNAAYQAIAPKLGCSPDSLRSWCQHSARDAGERAGLTSDEKARLKELERENRELRQANKILKKASAYFAPLSAMQASLARQRVGARPPVPQMIAFVEENRTISGVEPICRVLPIAPSTFYAHLSVMRDPERASNRAKRDTGHCKDIERIWKDNRQVYGARKVWHVLQREGKDIARCTVERLMKVMGLQGAVRGKKVITTNPDAARPCPDDRVNRQFKATAPNRLWVSDFTYVSSWTGMVYVAFIIDVFARRIVGWKVSTSMTTAFVLHALNQPICQRCPAEADGSIHHSDSSQYLSIKYTERLADAGIDGSVGTVGDSYDNAMAESIIGLFKTEVIKRIGPWKSASAVEWETLKWVDWYNNTRLLEPIGYITPNEAEANFYDSLKENDKAA